jgi:hypothetical protein
VVVDEPRQEEAGDDADADDADDDREVGAGWGKVWVVIFFLGIR